MADVNEEYHYRALTDFNDHARIQVPNSHDCIPWNLDREITKT